MQSVSQQQQENKLILERQISQLFGECISVWRDSDIKKSQVVRMLAARLEELCLLQEQPQHIQLICSQIVAHLKQNNLEATANHAYDYLEDKYKQPGYQHSRSGTGANAGNNDIEHIRRLNPLEERTPEQVQQFDEYAKAIAVEREANRQAAQIRKIALDDDKTNSDKIKTEMPEPRETVAYTTWQNDIMPVIDTMQKTHDEIGKKLKALPPDDEMAEDMVQPLAEYATLLRNVFEPINDFLAPLKDLKFATTKPRWWRIVTKYYDHGKHAAAVMDAINSHRYLDERDIKIRIIKCPTCEYFATVPDDADTPMHPIAREALRLLRDHQMDNHDKAVRYLCIKAETGKMTVQVPRERDLTREQVGDKIKELVELAITFVAAIKALKALSDWREKYTDGRVATRRISAHDKLSELA